MFEVDNSRHLVLIKEPSDSIHAVILVRKYAEELGFDSIQQSNIATAVSELATNIIRYAGKGNIHIQSVHSEGKIGIQVVAEDTGPGIEDPERAMAEQYSTGNSLGLGLPGVKRMMDQFEMGSSPGKGTRILISKWRDIS